MLALYRQRNLCESINSQLYSIIMLVVYVKLLVMTLKENGLIARHSAMGHSKWTFSALFLDLLRFPTSM